MPVNAAEIIIDPWAGLSHRAILNPGDAASGNLAPSWVGQINTTDVRRLNAYQVLASLIENTSRVFQRDVSKKSESREYGDAAGIRDAILAALLGDDLTVAVDGADSDKPEPPTTDEPATPGTPEDESPEDDVDEEDDDESFEQQLTEWQRATDRQEWVDEWWRYERGALKIHETERNAVGLGDGVYLFAWDNVKRRVRCRIFDPGFYFPVLSADYDDDYPDRCHLAWEYKDGDVWYVRRITFERVELADAIARGVEIEGATQIAADDDGDVGFEKTYPYADPDDDPSQYTVLMTDATWRRDQLESAHGVDTFTWDHATYNTNADGQPLRDFDLGIDFIPVLHIPNTVALIEHYGVSALTRVCQILDDMQATDTDLQAASAITGAPPISVSTPNASGQTTQSIYGPGTVFYGGTVTVADTSKSLDALLKLSDALAKRLSVNSHVPEEVLGRVKAGDISSGVQLALSFGPFRSLINELRLVRTDKYELFFRMLQRLSIVGGAGGAKSKAGGALDKSAPVLPINLKFGSYMPSDQKALVDEIVELVKAHLMPRSIALKLLDAAGIDIGDDLADVLEQIEAEDFEGAYRLAEATGSEMHATDYLGLKPDPNATPANKPLPAPAPTPAAPPMLVAPAPNGPAPAPTPFTGR